MNVKKFWMKKKFEGKPNFLNVKKIEGRKIVIIMLMEIFFHVSIKILNE